jgi:predicted nucleic acid-binding protein
MNANIFDVAMKRGQRIYLDVCCLNRPFDDQSQERVRIEAEAVKSVLRFIGTGKWIGVASEAVDFEVGRIADPDRFLEVSELAATLSEMVRIGAPERRRAKDLVTGGFKPMDAVHLACAEKARADVFLTTDDALLAKASRQAGTLGVRVANPLAWLKEMLEL